MKNRLIPKEGIGLALGSGSARGWAHVGVIRALEESDIKIDYIAGTSIGSLVAAVYASGKFNEMEETVLKLDRKQILMFSDVVLSKSGLIDGKKITKLIEQFLLQVPMESLLLPLHIVATDLATGKEIVMKEGDILEAIRASFSLPGIFTPVRKNGNILVDGGLVNPVPVSLVKEMGANFTIAVDLNSPINSKEYDEILQTTERLPDTYKSFGRTLARLNQKINPFDNFKLIFNNSKISKEYSPGIFEILMTSLKIMKRRITILNLEANPPDILIQLTFITCFLTNFTITNLPYFFI